MNNDENNYYSDGNSNHNEQNRDTTQYNQQYNNKQYTQNYQNGKKYKSSSIDGAIFVGLLIAILISFLFVQGIYRAFEVHDTSLSVIMLMILLILSVITILLYKIYEQLKILTEK